jgi:hypothetical protein
MHTTAPEIGIEMNEYRQMEAIYAQKKMQVINNTLYLWENMPKERNQILENEDANAWT